MITVDELKEALWLNQEEGRFYWNKKSKGVSIGSQAGSFDAYGYGQIRINRCIYKEHRLVWLYLTGKFPDDQIDHKNHLRRDNRFENLRSVNDIENNKNRSMQKNNTSGFVGVSFNKLTKKWESYITVGKKRKQIGYFSKLEDAILSRKSANIEFDFHENHGIGYGVSKKKRYDKNI